MMSNVGSAAAGKTLIGAGNGASPTFADIGTNSGLTAHCVVLSEGNNAFSTASPLTTGYVLTSNGTLADPSFKPVSSSGAITTITGSDSVAESPSAGNFNILGTGSITTVGSAATETIQLTGLTANNVLVGAGTTTITKVAPSATSGIPLVSNGAASDPSFTTAAVAGGGTGRTSLTNHGVLVGATTSAITQLAAGSAGQVLQSGGASADPAYSTATYPATTTVSQILYSSATNVVGGITTGNNQMLVTSGTGVPSISNTLAGNFSFAIGTAGSTEAVTIANNDNTNSSSIAVVIHSVGGTSAGDCYDRYVVGTTRSYSVGIDNSDTQSFKINTGASATTGPSTGSNVMRIDNTGNVALPLNSCVTADLNTGLTNATGDATFINPVIFDTDTGAFFDQNSNYDVTTGIFTAPATGKYLVTARVTFNGIGVAHTAGIIRINLNGSAYMISNFNPALSANAAAEYTAEISGILPIAATGTTAIIAQVSGGTKTVGVKGNTSGSFTSLSVVLVS